MRRIALGFLAILLLAVMLCVCASAATLQKGDNGAEVVELQKALIAQGYLNSTADGDYGNVTAKAVAAFQKANGLSETGIADDTTQDVIFGRMASEQSDTSTVEVMENGFTLQKGDKGENVKALQEKLISLGCLAGSADGDYGNMTMNAVKAFQKSEGLPETGVADEVTQEKLFEKKVEEIILSENSLVINYGKSETLTATVVPNIFKGKTITWRTSDETVATVKEGKIVAKDIGSCVITAEAIDGSGVVASCDVTVIRMITKVAFKPTSYSILLDEDLLVRPEFTPERPSNIELIWNSSDTSVATVDGGIVKAVSAGQCVITCTTTDGSNLTAECKITVLNKTFQALNFYYDEQFFDTRTEWFYNDDPTDYYVKSIRFSEKLAKIQARKNYNQLDESQEYPYHFENNTIIIESDPVVVIPFTVTSEKITLGTGKGDYFSKEDVHTAIKSCWMYNNKHGQAYSIRFSNGVYSSEHVSEDITGRYEYWYYGPYSGIYELTVGGFKFTPFGDSSNADSGWRWAIRDKKVVVLYMDQKTTKRNNLPGLNGYKLY